MSLFRRAIRLFLLIMALLSAAIGGLALLFFRYMVRPPRQPVWANPEDAGMRYEDVEFPARDGLRLSGWFIPAASAAGEQARGTVILVHGWPWNRLGEGATGLLATLSGAMPVDLLRLTHALHSAAYHVLSFDLRNHGQSASGGPVTFGLREANDILGALDFLAGREGVDSDRVAVVGFSMGANALLYALPRTRNVRAAVGVQPVSVRRYAERFAYDLLGPLSRPALALVDLLYSQASGMPLAAIEPLFAAAGAGETPVLYIQGEGDRWGSASNVGHMAAVTPNATGPVLVPSDERYGGYRYAVNHPEVMLDFLAQHLGEQA